MKKENFLKGNHFYFDNGVFYYSLKDNMIYETFENGDYAKAYVTKINDKNINVIIYGFMENYKELITFDMMFDVNA